MRKIKQEDVTQSVADSLQYISYFHPTDFLQALHKAYLREESSAARDAIAQILVNSRMCAMSQRLICQETGIVSVFDKVGMGVSWDNCTKTSDDIINEAFTVLSRSVGGGVH